jgi:hypothetical protein
LNFILYFSATACPLLLCNIAVTCLRPRCATLANQIWVTECLWVGGHSGPGAGRVPALPKRRQSDLVATRCLVVARTRPVLVNFTSTYIDLQPCVTNWMRKRCRHDHVRMAPGVRLCGAESVWSAASDRGRVRRPAMTEDPASAAPPTAQSVVPPKRQLRTRGPGHGKTPKLAPLC